MTDPITFNDAAERLAVIAEWLLMGRNNISRSAVVKPASDRDAAVVREIVAELDAMIASVGASAEIRAERDKLPDGGATLDRHLAAPDNVVALVRRGGRT